MTKKQTATQEAVANTKLIRDEIEQSIVLLDKFCEQHSFNINVPELFVNDVRHTAEMTWGVNVGLKKAAELTELFNSNSPLKRLKIEFIGNVNVIEEY